MDIFVIHAEMACLLSARSWRRTQSYEQIWGSAVSASHTARNALREAGIRTVNQLYLRTLELGDVLREHQELLGKISSLLEVRLLLLIVPL